MNHTQTTGPATDREIVITRVLDAPRKRVFEAWTDPDQVGDWWGPDGFTTTTHEMDARPGGVWRHTMHGPDGTDYPNHIRYEEVTPERIAYAHGSNEQHEDGFRSTVTFEDEDGGRRTRLTLRMVFPTAGERQRVAEFGAVQGGIQTVGRLAHHVAGDARPRLTLALPSGTEMLVTRVLDAPREQVFAAWTDPGQMKHWWGPRDYPAPRCETDLRIGGAYRFVSLDTDGDEHVFRGVYQEVEPPARLVATEVYEGFPDAEALNTATFEDLGDGHTLLTIHVQHQRREHRDGHLESGMEWGLAQSLERLEHLAQGLSGAPLRLERTLDASPAEVWAAWTDPDRLCRWFNPAPGLDCVVQEWDPRVGGRCRFTMPQPDGSEVPVEGVFLEMAAPRFLVQGAPDGSFTITTRLEPVGGRTRMTVEVAGVPPEFYDNAFVGWNAGFDKLETLLA